MSSTIVSRFPTELLRPTKVYLGREIKRGLRHAVEWRLYVCVCERLYALWIVIVTYVQVKWKWYSKIRKDPIFWSPPTSSRFAAWQYRPRTCKLSQQRNRPLHLTLTGVSLRRAEAARDGPEREHVTALISGWLRKAGRRVFVFCHAPDRRDAWPCMTYGCLGKFSMQIHSWFIAMEAY